MIQDFIDANIGTLKGKVGIYYKNLITGRTISHNSDKGFISASVIKVPILVEAFRQMENRIISKNDTITLCESDKMPSCGALSYMHSGLEVTIGDLCSLMIILSDNTATNILVKHLGMDSINRCMHDLGLKNTVLGRLLFDMEADKKGMHNIVSANDIGMLFELMWQEKLISRNASREMLDILKMQQLNHKIPARLGEEVIVAHKTGEDTGITHDAGIVYASRPFILCVFSEETDVPETNAFISALTYEAYMENS